MKNTVSEFINKRILEIQTEPTDEKFTSWSTFLYEKFLSHNNLLKEFSENCKPTQNQTDFARSISLHNIFKLYKKNKKFSKNISKECSSIINKNIEKFPQIEKISCRPPDNIKFESVLNCNLLKINRICLQDLSLIIDRQKDNNQIIIDLRNIVYSELNAHEKRIDEIQSELTKTPDIITKSLNTRTKTKDKPKVSIITVSYNLEKFVEETIRSVANQNFEEFEHIAIEGGSTDGSIELIKKHPDIILVSEKDTGYPDAFWKGLRVARGEYIMQCAISDGYAATEWIKKCVETLDKNKDISLVWGFPQDLTEDSKIGSISYPQFHYNEAPQKEQMFSYWLKTAFIYPEGNFCVRKSVMLKCYPTVKECKKGILDWLEFNYRFNSSGYISMHLPTLANFGRIHGNQLGEQLKKEGEMKIRANNYLKKITSYKIKLLTGLVRHHFIDSEGNKVDLKFDKKKFVMEDIIRIFFRIDNKYLKPKKYFDFIKTLVPSFIKETIKKKYSYIIWFIKDKPIPPPDFIKEKIIKKYAFRFSPKVFIETGTYYGDKINALKHLFLKIISIELDKELYEKAKQRFKDYSNIEIIQGDSSKILPKILPGISGKILFWLDAHYSGSITARGKKETPILNELKAIFNSHPKENIILIDDARLFVGKNDYPTVDELIDNLRKSNNLNFNYKIENDIIIIQLLDK